MRIFQPFASLRDRILSTGYDLLAAGILIQPLVFLLLLVVVKVEAQYFPESYAYLRAVSARDWFGAGLKYFGGLAFPLMWVLWMGSVGKRLRRLRIVDARTGLRITPWRAALRYTVYFSVVFSGYFYWWDYSMADAASGAAPHREYLIAAAFLLPLLTIPLTRRRQAVHDWVSGTAVVYLRVSDAMRNESPDSPAKRRFRWARDLVWVMAYYLFLVLLIVLVNTPFGQSP